MGRAQPTLQSETLLAYATQAETMECRDAVLRGFLDQLGALGIRFMIFVTVDQDMGERYLWSNVGIHEHPKADAVIDPFLTYCCSAYASTFTGVEFVDEYPYLSEDETAFIREAGELGFKSGIAFPVALDAQGRFGGFNLGTGFDRETFLRTIPPLEDTLALACVLIAKRIEALPVTTRRSAAEAPADLPGKAQLTPRDRDILYFVSQGLARKEIARVTALSPNTVNSYVKSLYAKLGVSNRAEATRAALRLGLRPPRLPVRPDTDNPTGSEDLAK